MTPARGVSIGMECTRCHAVIAEKAIVCYRCGTPTAIPAPPERKTVAAGAPWMLVALLVAVAIVTGWLATTSEPGTTRLGLFVAGGTAFLAAGYFALRRPR